MDRKTRILLLSPFFIALLLIYFVISYRVNPIPHHQQHSHYQEAIAAAGKEEGKPDTVISSRHVWENSLQHQSGSGKELASSSEERRKTTGVGAVSLHSPPNIPSPFFEDPVRKIRIFFLTVQTSATAPWCRMLFSASRSGVVVHNLGWGKKYGHSKRPGWILDWIDMMQRKEDPSRDQENSEALSQEREEEEGRSGKKETYTGRRKRMVLEESDVLMFSDGGDTVYTGTSPHHTLEWFLRARMDIETGEAFIVPSYQRGEKGRGLFDAKEEREEVVGVDTLKWWGPTTEEEGECGFLPFGSQGSKSKVNEEERRTRRLIHPGIIFNGERNCYHPQTFSGVWAAKKGQCLAAYIQAFPHVRSPSRFLNGGAWIGHVWAAKKLFAEARQIISKNRYLWCDQSVIGAVYLSRKYDRFFTLDYSNGIFLPTYHMNPDSDFCVGRGKGSKRSEGEEGTQFQKKLSPVESLLFSDVNDQSASEELDAENKGVAAASRERKNTLQHRSSMLLNRPNMTLCHSGYTPSLIHFNGKSAGRITQNILKRTTWYSEYLELQRDANSAMSSSSSLQIVKRFFSWETVMENTKKPIKEVCSKYISRM